MNQIRKIANQPTKQRTYRRAKSTNRSVKTTKQKHTFPSVPSVSVSPHSSPSFPPLSHHSIFRPAVPLFLQLSSFLSIFTNVIFVSCLGCNCLFATCSVGKCYGFRWNLKETYRKNWRQGNIPRYSS